jgi:hypothetical protein
MKQTLKQQLEDLKRENRALKEKVGFTNRNIVMFENLVNEKDNHIIELEKEVSYLWEMIILDKDNDWTDEIKPITNKQKEILEIVADVEKNSFLTPIYLLNKCRFIIHPKFEPVPF